MFARSAIAIVVALVVVSLMSCQQHDSTPRASADSLALLTHRIDSMQDRMPGLGEYMSAVQLHISKLWFAARAGNWALADYEIGEAREAFDGAIALHAKRNSIDISPVLQSMVDTLIAPVHQSVATHILPTFERYYRSTLDGCNTCHSAAGYPFIHIIVPTAPPVTNQRWGE